MSVRYERFPRSTDLLKLSNMTGYWQQEEHTCLWHFFNQTEFARAQAAISVGSM